MNIINGDGEKKSEAGVEKQVKKIYMVYLMDLRSMLVRRGSGNLGTLDIFS